MLIDMPYGQFYDYLHNKRSLLFSFGESYAGVVTLYVFRYKSLVTPSNMVVVSSTSRIVNTDRFGPGMQAPTHTSGLYSFCSGKRQRF